MASTLLVFDVDGTLIDSRRDLCTAVNLVRKHYGLDPLPADIVGGYIGDGISLLVKRSLDVPGIDLEEAVGLQRKFYEQHMFDESVLYPGVERVLQGFNELGCKLAVASNKQAVFSERILEHFRLRDLFCHVAGDGNSRFLKPHPAMVIDGMRVAGAPAAQTWMIGDSHTDLETARRAGVRSVFMTSGIGHRGDETPDEVCSSFDDLWKLLSAQGPRFGLTRPVAAGGKSRGQEVDSRRPLNHGTIGSG